MSLDGVGNREDRDGGFDPDVGEGREREGRERGREQRRRTRAGGRGCFARERQLAQPIARAPAAPRRARRREQQHARTPAAWKLAAQPWLAASQAASGEPSIAPSVAAECTADIGRAARSRKRSTTTVLISVS